MAKDMYFCNKKFGYIPYLPVCDLPKIDGNTRNNILNKLFNKFKGNFIEIGANDGIENDPLHTLIKSNKPPGILVEPNPEVFNKLKNNYKLHNNLQYENSGITENDGMFELYVPKKHSTQASFMKECMKNDNYNTHKVNGITFDTLINKYNIQKIGLIHIDAEGLDCMIINQILASGILPTVLEFENNILTKIEDSVDILNALKDNDYICYHVNYQYACYDVIAIHRSIYDKIY